MIKAKPKEANYEFTDEELSVHLAIEFETGTYTLWAKDNKLDFNFMGSEPARGKRIISLMLAATDYALKSIKFGRAWENVADTIKATVTTDIEIGSVRPKPVELATFDDPNGGSEDDSNSPHSNPNRERV